MSLDTPSEPERLADDLLIGAAAIAEFLFGTPDARRRVFHLASQSHAPIGRLGSRLVARRSDLTDYIKPPRKPPSRGK